MEDRSVGKTEDISCLAWQVVDWETVKRGG